MPLINSSDDVGLLIASHKLRGGGGFWGAEPPVLKDLGLSEPGIRCFSVWTDRESTNQ